MKYEFPNKYADKVTFDFGDKFTVEHIKVLKKVMNDKKLDLFKDKSLKLNVQKGQNIYEILACFDSIHHLNCHEDHFSKSNQPQTKTNIKFLHITLNKLDPD